MKGCIPAAGSLDIAIAVPCQAVKPALLIIVRTVMLKRFMVHRSEIRSWKIRVPRKIWCTIGHPFFH